MNQAVRNVEEEAVESEAKVPGKKPAFPLVWTIVAAMLAALAANTLFQLQLGEAIHEKAVKLEQELNRSAESSRKMNEQLEAIQQLNLMTKQLNEKLGRIKANTQGMHREIADLDRIVAGIAAKVGQIDGNTKTAREQVAQIAAALSANIAIMQQMARTNEQIVSSLTRMEKIQTQVNQNLAAMNEKTKILENASLLQNWGLSP
ncbi:hypothetical protein G3578_03760 [Brevibacillus sp. SYP-B805]|uniref:hypothetical protein n=1 Tax=Brevibacillus sp. SYP-B805 TaxID=1578199 RepID=UPI0013ECDDE4|nr:hypothetical protein [Brevibacillus sp. SYP-B805]NGQ94290.1 hypothetical protein [Brevibacillus sp. SYP-B805]